MNERQFGMGIGPIPRSAMREYCADLGITGDQRDTLYYCVDRLDKVYMEWWNAESERKAKQKSRGKK